VSIVVASDTSLNAVVSASVGQGFMAILKADQERQFPLIFKRGELLEDNLQRDCSFRDDRFMASKQFLLAAADSQGHLFISKNNARAQISEMTSRLRVAQ
jgi:hypothetical protein